MKVLHVNHLIDPVTGGGTAERTYQLTRFLIKEEVECGVLTLDIGSIEKICEELRPAQIYRLWCLNSRYFLPIFSIFKLIKLIKSFDVVHLMGHWTVLNAMVGLCCMMCRIPYVVCPAGALQTLGRSHYLKKIYDFVIGRRLVRSASAWIAITEAEKTDFLKHGIRPGEISVIPNGIDPEQYLFADQLVSMPAGLEEKIGKSPYVLFLGRLHWVKGPDLLLEAFISIANQFPDIHLVFAGPDAGMLDSLQSLVADVGECERIHFLGYVGGRDKISLLSQAACLVIPSRNEAMSIVVLEAGVCCVPVIFTDRCGLNDLAEANAGCMVSADSANISRGMIQVLSSAQDRQRFTSNLNLIIKRDYLWINQARKYQDVYRALLHDL